MVSAVGAEDAGGTATSSSKFFMDKFGWIWTKLRRNLGKIESKFGKK